MTISGIPSTRVSDTFVRDRLLTQLHADQIALFQIEQQISTGRRILTPSDDAPAAIRAQALQSLLEQKLQVQKNVETNQSFLNASDAALGNVSGLLSDIRATTLSVSDSFATDTQRQAAVQEVREAIRQLVDVGNQQFRDRFLFAGSQTNVRPFEEVDGYVMYHGNEGVLRSYSDIDTLFTTSISGNDVFGAISEPVRGTSDINPAVTRDTKLSDLRGGLGVSLGAINVADGSSTTTVDFAGAETIGDVIDLLEANPPDGRTVTVRLSENGLNIELDTAGGGNLTITEVGQGRTASELGILEPTGVLTGPLVGGDLDPRVRGTTRLDDLFGKRGEAVIPSAGADNDLLISAIDRGTDLNGVTISFVDGGPPAAGNETAVYNAGAGTLQITIADGITSANAVVDLINNDAALNGLFAATLDGKETGNGGIGAVELAATGTIAGGSGVEFDKDSGLQIVNANQTFEIDLSAAETVEDVVNIINASEAYVVASINATGNGIDIRSKLSGSDFAIGENGGITATQLGLRSFRAENKLNELNFGTGVQTVNGADFEIRRKDGTRLQIDVSDAKTVQDVIDAINNHADNLDPTTAVTAQLAEFGNGIELTTTDTSTAASLQVTRLNFSEAAIDLGLVPAGQETSDPAIADTIRGRDVNLQEVEGVFNSLVKLAKALEINDFGEISRTIEQLDQAAINVNFARGDIGARSQGLDVVETRLDLEEIELRDALSKEIDVDLAAAISEFTARQASLQASLQTSALISRLSLIDYL